MWGVSASSRPGALFTYSSIDLGVTTCVPEILVGGNVCPFNTEWMQTEFSPLEKGPLPGEGQ